MKKLLCGVLISSLLPLTAYAAVKGKPGLWQMTVTMDLGIQIPPEQLAQMKQMGIKIPGMGGTPIISKQCLTQEQAESDQMPRTQREDSGCTTTKVETSGNTTTAAMHCDGRLKGDGNSTVTYENAESYKGSWRFKGTEEHGNPVNMKSDFAGKWLGTDCGDIKPYKSH